jgi:predicted nucleic acid-binding Zn ribbon protein
MKLIKTTSDQLHCKSCGTVIPKGQTKCPNPKCPTNKPLHDKTKTTIRKMKLLEV